VFYGDTGKLNECLEEAQQTMRLAPEAALSYQVLSRAFMGLNRFAETKSIKQRQIDLKLDGTGDHRTLYALAFLEGNSAEMQRQADWAKGKPDEFIVLDGMAEAAAFSGRLQKARELHGQAVEIAQRGKFQEAAANMAARFAIIEAVVGNSSPARQQSQKALAMDRGRESLPFAGLAAAMAGDSVQATGAADELKKRFPLDTVINNISLPAIHASNEINRGNPAKAVEMLQTSVPYEFGWESRVTPNYIRGLAYLKMGQGSQAASDFQKVLDHRGVCSTLPMCSLSHLQLGRALTLTGDKTTARTAYQDFFALWKDADPDVPILKEAKAEYAKLQQ
jgi:tetratricopeptide (TPR) repeat protein